MERLFSDADKSVKSSLSMKPSLQSLNTNSKSRANESPGLSRKSYKSLNRSLENSAVLSQVKFKEMRLKQKFKDYREKTNASATTLGENEKNTISGPVEDATLNNSLQKEMAHDFSIYSI